MFTRPLIDSLDFARKGMEISGEVPMAELPRLADLLTDSEGKLRYVLRGFEGKDGKPQLGLTITGACNLRCQRCLKPLRHPIDLVSKLRLVSEGDAEGTDIDDDEVDNIPAEKRFDVLALLEEELILSMPIAPKHEIDECHMAVEGLNRSNNPFSVLAALKK